MAINEQAILKSELRWAWVVAGIVAIILGAILFAALSMHINPPSNREFVDPKTLHLSAEFTESNLGTRVDPDGQIVARLIATQFEFVPSCIVLPAAATSLCASPAPMSSTASSSPAPTSTR